MVKPRLLFARKGLTLFELVICIIIILILIGTWLIFVYRVTLRAKESVLRIELNNLRVCLLLYKAVNGKVPEDLKALMQARYQPQGSDEVLFGKEFLNIIGQDHQSYPIDPFGSKFGYISEKEVVYSQTKGYKNW